MRYTLICCVLLSCGPVDPETCESILIEMHRDLDGDGFGGGAPQTVCAGTPGWVNNGLDCADGDPRAFPGQTEWQARPISGPTTGGQAWDFDCDGLETRRWLASASCYVNTVSGGCYSTSGPVEGYWPRGVTGPAPACGEQEDWIFTCVSAALQCRGNSERRTQACL
jgi:hypothetical protein